VFESRVPGDSLDTLDSLDTVEFVMELEEAAGVDISLDDEISREDLMFRVLLGPGFTRCAWAVETISSRSIRGIVEERVRLRGDCGCWAGAL
jgi:hypothetical protein